MRLSPCSSRSRPVANWPKAYAWMARSIGESDGWEAGTDWGERALQLAEDLGDTETALDARKIIAWGLPEGGLEAMEQILEDAAAGWPG